MVNSIPFGSNRPNSVPNVTVCCKVCRTSCSNTPRLVPLSNRRLSSLAATAAAHISANRASKAGPHTPPLLPHPAVGSLVVRRFRGPNYCSRVEVPRQRPSWRSGVENARRFSRQWGRSTDLRSRTTIVGNRVRSRHVTQCF
jgi:hypothetical protein